MVSLCSPSSFHPEKVLLEAYLKRFLSVQSSLYHPLFIKATTLDYLRVVSEKKYEMNIPVLLLVPYQEWYLDLDSRRHICHLRFHLQNETALLKY